MTAPQDKNEPLAGEPSSEAELTDELIAARRTVPASRPADMPLWMWWLIAGIDRFSLWVGRVVAWLVLLVMAAMVYEITARYMFRAPTIWAYDISRMLYGAYFILGAGYALSRGVHMRADFLYRRLSVQRQGLVDASLYLLLYFPAMAIFLVLATEYATSSLFSGERGMDTAWMPLLGPIKSALPLGILFLFVQGGAEFLKSLYAVRSGKWI